MRIRFSSCTVGLGIALLLAAVPTARAQQQDPPRRTSSTRRIRVTKDGPTRPAPVATQRVNQDSIVSAERARQDSIAAAERARQDSMAAAERARQDQVRQAQSRNDSITIAERHRQDSIAAADQARQDSIAHAQDSRRSSNALRMARRYNSGFYIAVAGGQTMPMGDIKQATTNSYNMGWNVTVPFGWDFGPLGLRFDLAMDNLMGKTNAYDQLGNPTTPRNIAIYSGSGGLKLNLPIFRTASRFYVIGGAGAHRITGYATSQAGSDSAQTIQNAKTDIGWYGGGGLNFRFGRTAMFIESRYINVNAKKPAGFAYDKVNYLPIIVGIGF